MRLIKKIIKEVQSCGFLAFLKKSFLFVLDSRRRRIKKEIESWRRDSNKITKQEFEVKFTKNLVSVIIPVYDRIDKLRASIDSILNQTYKNYELILVTDGSPQKTMEVVESYRNHPKVKIFHYYDNSGNAVRGRNKGLKEASGEFIAFQDSDDISEPDRLERSVNFIKKTGADLIYGGWRAKVSRDYPGKNIKDGQELEARDFEITDLLKENYICQSAVLARRSALLAAGGFKRIMHYREDHEFWLRLLFNGYKFKAMPGIVCNLSLHGRNNELKFLHEDNKWYDLMLNEYKKTCELPLKVVYIIPGTEISGGVGVVLQHTNRLLKLGYDVSILSQDLRTRIDWFPKQKVPIYPIDCEDYYKNNIDVLVATSWSTVPSMDNINAKRKIYFVQSDERRFFEDEERKKLINETYKMDCEYMTEAKWIQKWLKDEFGHESYYVPNGLDEKLFFRTEPIEKKGPKSRVLIEGAIDIPYKGVEDAYRVASELDCEIWIVSNGGNPKVGWRYDRFFQNVPMIEMRRIYSSCDIFLKMSRVEGFFGPPLEAMACGCAVVVGKVTGYDEYIRNGYNALVVDQGDIEGARNAVKKLIDDKDLRNKIIRGGYETAKKWSWEKSIDHLIKVIGK